MIHMKRFMDKMTDEIAEAWVCWLFSPFMSVVTAYSVFICITQNAETIIGVMIYSAIIYISLVIFMNMVLHAINTHNIRNKIIAKRSIYDNICKENEQLFLRLKYNLDGNGYRSYEEIRKHFPDKSKIELKEWNKRLSRKFVPPKKKKRKRDDTAWVNDL